MATLVWIGDDLMFAPMVGRAARDAGLTLRQVASLEGAEQATQSAPDGEVVAWLVDLQTPGLAVEQIAARASGQKAPPRTIAYGPHVGAATLATATDTGVAHVMTQGQFHRDAPAILARLASIGESS